MRLFLGRDANGKRNYLNKTVHGNKKAAQKWLTKALRDKDLGVTIEPAQGTLNEFLDKWLKEAAKGKVRRKTYASYEYNLGRYIRPVLGLRPFAKIGPMEIQSLYNGLLESGLSARTIEYTNMMLKQAFRQAINWRLLIYNPCDGVRLPRKVRKEMQVFDADQSRRFLAACKSEKHGLLLEVAVTTGLRPSEYLALKWSDLDIGRQTASVNRSLDFLPGGGWEFNETKKPRSRRTIKLHSNIAHTLQEHKTRQDEEKRMAGENWTNFDLVFANEHGGPVDRHNLANRDFRRILANASLPQIRLYDLRHTFATLALAAGVPVKVVSEQLGHASAALTLDIYSHVLPHMQDEAVAKVEALLMGKAEPKHVKTGEQHTPGTLRLS